MNLAPKKQSAIGKRLQATGQFLFNVGLFIRFPALGATIIIALFGGVSISSSPSSRQMAGIVMGAIAFHSFAYVLNDLVDLPIDRTEPRRAQFPLVRGLVQPWQALLFALLQIPIMVAITAWLGGDRMAYGMLGMGFSLMVVYDLWGKRTAVPLLTDLIQGIAWGALALWAAAIVPGDFTGLTGVLFTFVVLFIILINGIHGSLRDLPNDFNHGAYSTAVLLGARPQGANSIVVPPRLKLYAGMLQAALISVTLLPLLNNQLNYSPAARGVTAIMILILTPVAWHSLMKALDSAHNRAKMLAAGAVHLLVSYGALVALFAFRLPWQLQTILLPLFLAPLLTHSWIRNAIKWAWRSINRKQTSPPGFPTPRPPSTAQRAECD